jgi:hypothetical protein
MLSFKLTKQARLNPEAFRVELLARLRTGAQELDKRLGKTTATWEGEKPKFETQIGLSATEATLEAAATGPQKGIDKWLWLNYGTKVRYAILSKDWSSKTAPGFVGSGPGAGRVVKIDVNHPQPGIEPRHWGVLILKEFKPQFRQAMREALLAGAERAKKE